MLTETMYGVSLVMPWVVSGAAHVHKKDGAASATFSVFFITLKKPLKAVH